MSKQILSIGQCSADHFSISQLMKSQFGASVQRSSDLADALTSLKSGSYDLILINRVLDADGSSGLKIIEVLKQDPDLGQVPVMLVSNYSDAQAAAIAAGALPGFGKSELNQPATLAKLKEILD